MFEKIKLKAFSLGATEFGKSKNKNKRFYVVYKGKIINFGQLGATTFIDGASEIKKNAFHARHKKILLKDGTLAYLNKNQPSYWAYHLLWA
jgi:hypothetical protein